MTVIDQPILEEPEDTGILNESTSKAIKMILCIVDYSHFVMSMLCIQLVLQT